VQGIRVLCASAAAPGLPYVTAATTSATDVARLQAGIASAFADPVLKEIRAALLLDGCEILPRSAYDVIPAMEQAAIAAGYPQLQ
jgi:hypothetical protein